MDSWSEGDAAATSRCRGLEANEEPDADAKGAAEPEWIDQFDAEDLVRQSNYWSRVKRRSALDKIEAKRDYEEYDIEPETDPYELESEEIAPPRHTPNVDALSPAFLGRPPRWPSWRFVSPAHALGLARRAGIRSDASNRL